MSEMVTKMSVQEKVAELERRVAELERGRGGRSSIIAVTREHDEAWGKLWKAFDDLFAHIFKGSSR